MRQDRPTASFYTNDDKDDHITIVEGSNARLPLRLTGERPWRLLFRNVDRNPDKVFHAQLNDANDQLTVKDPGRYELVNVQDSYCPGDVSNTAITVSFLDKPALGISEDQVSYKQHGIFERPPVCEGTDDAVNVHLSGTLNFAQQFLFAFSLLL